MCKITFATQRLVKTSIKSTQNKLEDSKMGHEVGRTIPLSVHFRTIPLERLRIGLVLLVSHCIKLHMPLLTKAV
jgi:hypothetical protein